MRFLSTVVAALAVAQGASAVGAQKAIIVTYPSDISMDVVNRAMNEIRQAGGVITHEYNLIKGFAAKAPQKIIESVTAWGAEYHAVVEEDSVVEANKNVA